MSMLLNSNEVSRDIGALTLRLAFGGTLFWHHGLDKLSRFGELASSFGDPLGVGHTASLVLILFAEVVCAALVLMGIWTRISTIPVIIGMAVAAFMANGDQPFAKQELGFLYMMAFIVIFFIGGGKYSLGRLSFR